MMEVAFTKEAVDLLRRLEKKYREKSEREATMAERYTGLGRRRRILTPEEQLERYEARLKRKAEKDAIEARGMAIGFGRREEQIARAGDPGATHPKLKEAWREELPGNMQEFFSKGGSIKVVRRGGGVPRTAKFKSSTEISSSGFERRVPHSKSTARVFDDEF